MLIYKNTFTNKLLYNIKLILKYDIIKSFEMMNI